jgi:hypothetical protein
VYATKEYVDRAEMRLYGRETLLKEDVGAVGETVVEILEGQQRLAARVETIDGNLRAVMRHLGVPEVESAGPSQS